MSISMAKADNLPQAVLAVLAWFDLFAYPLSSRELWRYLDCPATLAEVEAVLPTLPQLECSAGLWHLRGRTALVAERQRRVNYSDRKFKKAARLAACFAWLPWLQLVAVVNQIGSNNLSDDGDIDLLLVCSPRRLWLTRLLLAGVLKILDLRPRPGHSRDTYCLSFLLSSQQLNLQDLKQSADDRYFDFWLAGLVPVWARSGCLADFWQANAWLSRRLPNWQAPAATRRLRLASATALPSAYLDWLEAKAMTWQISRLPAALKDLANTDSRVVIGPTIIKLHANDRRRQFMEAWRQKLTTL